MARSPIFPVLQGYHALTPEQQKIFLDLVDPQVEPIEAPKQTRKKRGPNKPRIAGLPKPGSEAPKAEAGKPHLREGPVCTICYHTEDYEDHSRPSPHYHPFEPPVAAAGKKSRQKTAATSSTANTEGEIASAMSASSGGD